MFDLLEQLRKKPVSYRKRVLFLSTSVITGLIALVWLSTFNLTNGGSEMDVAAVEKQLKPIDEIKTNVASFYDTVKTVSAGIFSSAAASSSSQSVE